MSSKEKLSITDAKNLIKENAPRIGTVRAESRCYGRQLFNEEYAKPSQIKWADIFKDKEILPGTINGREIFFVFKNPRFAMFDTLEDAEKYAKDTPNVNEFELVINNYLSKKDRDLSLLKNQIIVCELEERKDKMQEYLTAITLFEIEAKYEVENLLTRFVNGEITPKNNC